MKIKSTITSSGQEGPTVLVPGQWNMIYASFFYNVKTVNAASIILNGVTTDSAPYTNTGYYPSVFSNSDVIKIGAGFIGQLRRLQIYSPAAYLLDKSLFLFYWYLIKLTKARCDLTTCAVNIGYSDPPKCLKAICNTSGSYASLDTCESTENILWNFYWLCPSACPGACSTCTNPTTCQSCSPGFFLIGTTCTKCPNTKYAPSPTATSCVGNFILKKIIFLNLTQRLSKAL